MAGRAVGRSARGEAVGFHRTQRALGQGTGGRGDGAWPEELVFRP